VLDLDGQQQQQQQQQQHQVEVATRRRPDGGHEASWRTARPAVE
jgi:hypothetical protein